MVTRFSGKVALVTGGRSGIGRAIARRFREEGARVITAQRGSDTDGEWIEADFAAPQSAPAVIAEVVKRAGRLDVLVNNAGVMQEARAEDMPLADFERTLAVNLVTPFMLIKAALPHLRASRGAIVNIGSIEGLGPTRITRPIVHQRPDCTVDARHRRGSWGRRHSLQCRCTGMDRHRPQRGICRCHSGPRGLSCQHWQDSSSGRTGKPEEVAALTAWLASDEAAFVAGQVWTIDGGRMAKLSLPS